MNVYDFDKTIYKSDSTTDFFIYCMLRHPRILTLLPEIICGFCKYYIFRKGSKTEFKSHIMKFVRYIDYPEDINCFWDRKIAGIKKYYLNQQMDTDIIISASPRFVLEPVCKRLGINNLLCSEVDVNTGRYSGENCHGKEKVRRFYEYCPDGVIDSFYSDSYSDTPLAEISKEAFIVKGEKLSPWEFNK